MPKKILAWHFVGKTLRDGSPIPADEVTLRHKGDLVICRSGFHASRRLIDALEYAPGPELCRVEMSGEMLFQRDKLVARERTILWRIDAEMILSDFARRCALDVIHLWDAPDIVVRYLKTGDETIRDATRDATRAAAWGGAACDAARDAARAAYWGAACDVAWDAARDAARAAAMVAARAATMVAAWDAAMVAAWDAAMVAAREKQNRRLTAMVSRPRSQ